MELYHGTTTNITDEFLKPHKPFETYEYNPIICFTDKKALALLYTTNPIRAYFKNQNIAGRANAFSDYFKFCEKENRVVVCECYEGMLEEVYNISAYLYTFEYDGAINKESSIGYEFNEPIKYEKKIFIPNVLSELLELEKLNIVKIIRFNDLDFNIKSLLYDNIAHRANACENQGEVEFFKEKFKGINSVLNYLHLNTIPQ